MIASGWNPRQTLWSASSLIDSIDRASVVWSTTQLEEHRDYFWFDLCAEWDSLYLHQELHQHGQQWSPEFLRFEQAWYEDEINHAEGFLSLYSLLYQESKDSIRTRLGQRQPDFEPVSEFLNSEFDICLLFAYDELATMRAYHMDIPLYRSLGPAPLVQWIRQLIRDETHHHKNGFDLVILNHKHRMAEISAKVDGFLAHDGKNPDYRATFIFDHEWDHVAPDFFQRTGAMLKSKFASMG